MRLIDADALTYKMIVSRNVSEAPWEHYVWMQNTINDAPTIDPERHGHWVYVERGRDRCSECLGFCVVEEVNGAPHEIHTNYCPHCGAKMEVNDNEKL